MRKRSRQLIGVLMASAMVISTNVVIPNEYTYAQEDTSSIKSSGVKDNVNKVVQVDIGSMVYTDAEVVKSNTFTINITNRENRLLIYGINGDLNSDSKIDIRDAMSCLRHVSGREDLDCVREGFADVNFDEKVNIQDLIKEIHVVSGREDNF